MPFMVPVLNIDGDLVCSATFLLWNMVLTAAQCCSPDKNTAWVGETMLSDMADPLGKVHVIDKCITHPQYTLTYDVAINKHDIAIIKVEAGLCINRALSFWGWRGKPNPHEGMKNSLNKGEWRVGHIVVRKK